MQAARGASLSDDDTTDRTGTSDPRRAVRLKLVFAAVAAAAYATDLVTKQLAVTRLADGDVLRLDARAWLPLTGALRPVRACGPVRHLALSGRALFAASNEEGEADAHELRVWDLDTGEELAACVRRSSLIEGLALSPDRRWLISATGTGRLEVWDVAR